MKTRVLVFTVVVVQLAACDSGTEAGPANAVRDSAGIRIVENLSPHWAQDEQWWVDAEPLLDLSEADDHELFRVGSPRRLPDGRLALFNGGSCEVRLYDADGGFLSAVGRCGEGPGEFGQFARVRPWPGDSLLVVEHFRRLTVLTNDGRLARTLQLPTSSDIPRPVVRGVLADGTLVLTGLRDPVGRREPGVEAAQTQLGLLRELDEAPTFVRGYPGPVYEYTEFAGTLGRGELAFSSSPHFAVGISNFFTGLPETYEIHAYTADGRLDQIIRRAYESVPVTQRDIDWLMERRLAQVESEENQRAVRQAFRDLRHADFMPAFGPPVWPGGAQGGPAMLVDDDGNLWVFAHYRPSEYRNDWSVFSPDGIWLGNVALPEGLTPSQIGTEFVLGLWTNEVGFTHVRLHRLVKR